MTGAEGIGGGAAAYFAMYAQTQALAAATASLSGGEGGGSNLSGGEGGSSPDVTASGNGQLFSATA
jgi:hypothetical protein